MFETITKDELEADVTNACRVWEVVDFNVYWDSCGNLRIATPYVGIIIDLRFVGTVDYPRWKTELWQITGVKLLPRPVDIGSHYDAFMEYAEKMQDVLNSITYPKRRNLLVTKEVEKEA